MNDLLKLAVGTHSLGWTLIYAFFLLFVLVRSEPLVRNFWIAEIFQFLISFAEVRDEIVYVFERHSPKRILMAVFRTQKQSTLQPFLPLAADARPPRLSFNPSEWRSRLRVLVLALVDLERKNRRGHAAQPASQIWFTVSQGILDNWTKSETGKEEFHHFVLKSADGWNRYRDFLDREIPNLKHITFFKENCSCATSSSSVHRSVALLR